MIIILSIKTSLLRNVHNIIDKQHIRSNYMKLHQVNIAAQKLQQDLIDHFKTKFGDSKLATLQQTNKLPQSSICNQDITSLIFVKWIRKSGVSMKDPNFKYDSDITSVDDFDTSTKSCSNGIHIMPIECALGYLFQENLICQLNDLSLLACSIPIGTTMIRHTFRLYSKIRVKTFAKHGLISFKDNFKALPICDEKTKFDIINHGPPFMTYFDSEIEIWRMAYWLANSNNAYDIVRCKQLIENKYVDMHKLERESKANEITSRIDQERQLERKEEKQYHITNKDLLDKAAKEFIENTGSQYSLLTILAWETHRNKYLLAAEKTILNEKRGK